MPAPKRPNTTAATAAVVRRGQETQAAKLRAAGWLVLSPEEAATILDESRSAHVVAEWFADKARAQAALQQ